MRILSTAIAIALTTATIDTEAKTPKKQAEPRLSALEAVEKANDRWQAVSAPYTDAFWDNAVYFTGNMEAYKLTGNAKYLEYSDKWARHNKWTGAAEQDRDKWVYKTYGEDDAHVLFGDWQACFQTYMDMYEMNPDDYKTARAKEVLGTMASMTETDFWWWVDALYMSMPALAKMYRLTGDEHYLDKLTECFSYTDSLLFDEDEHLYYRDAKYVYPAHKTGNGKKDFWARGNGWAMAGLAKTLADMPMGYNGRATLYNRFIQLAEAAANCQQEDGYWTRSLIDADQAKGQETSGTALITYALLYGVNNGLLDKNTYAQTIEKAWNYLAYTALQEDGTVGYVQPIGEQAAQGGTLNPRSSTNFGTGAFLLAACEKARYDDGSVNSTDKGFTVTVSNDQNRTRQEVVEIDAGSVFDKLGIEGGRQFQVYNAVGQQVPYQLTYDGKVLIEACVRPLASAQYTIKKGAPKTFANTCYGRMYPERVDDIAWENDRCAYRCYGPALQRTGEDAYGIDVWLKNTPDLVVESRYYLEDVMKPVIAELKKTDAAAADSLNMLTSYHFDQGHGLDCYKVGPTLGCGTPALLSGDSIIFPYCYKDYEILDNGPLRFTVKLVYNPADINGNDSVVENRLLSIDKGTNFNTMTVWYDGLDSPCDLAAGVVIHTEDTESVTTGSDYVQYADPTDNPAGQNFQIYVAALFPNGVDETKKIMYKNPTRGNAGHAVGIIKGYSGDKYTYCFGSAWSNYDCRSQDEWQLRIDAQLNSLNHPLTVTME